MSKTTIMSKLTRGLYKTGFKLKKHSPEILITAGIIGTVASAVMACKATTKAGEILEETKTQLDTINEVVNNPKMKEKYSEEDKQKDLSIVYIQTGVKFAKLYGPAVLLGVVSISCILASHNILRKRNIAIAAAYAAVDKGFKEYRGRVIDRFGKELDHELKYNIKSQEIEKVTVDENGKEVKELVTDDVFDPNSYSPYAVIYDDGNAGWDKDVERSKFFLIQQQNFSNEKLKRQGYLFLNDVYKMIGAKATKMGQVVGWVYNEAHPIGDNFVDFGIFDINNPRARDFVNGYERAIVLDFNVDGNILDYL